MIKKNSTMYSVVGSLGAHVLFTLGAGSFLLNINDSIIPQKTYKLEFVKRKAPPPVKKKEIRKEVVRKEIKVASLQPKVVPVMQPKTVVRETEAARPVASVPRQVQAQKVPVVQSAVIHSSPPAVTRQTVASLPRVRSFVPVNHSRTGMVHKETARVVRSVPMALQSSAPRKTTPGKETTKVAMVQGASHFTPRNLPKQAVRSFSSSPSTKRSRGRVALIQRNTTRAQVPKTAPQVSRNSASGDSSGSQRVALVQGSISRAQIPKTAPQVFGNSGSDDSPGSQRVAMVQGSISRVQVPQTAPQVFGSSESGDSSGSERVAPKQTGVKLASFSLPAPRGVPNIIDAGALKGYIGRVKRSIEGAKRYPEASRKAGREGRLKVQFTILRNGEVDNVRLLTRSPYENLNREALAAVKRAAPFSGLPDSLAEQSLQVILPFRFELN